VQSETNRQSEFVPDAGGRGIWAVIARSGKNFGVPPHAQSVSVRFDGETVFTAEPTSTSWYPVSARGHEDLTRSLGKGRIGILPNTRGCHQIA